MFEGIKERLGFGGDDQFDGRYEDDYDSYDDTYDNNESYDDANDAYSSYAPVTTRDASSRGYTSTSSRYASGLSRSRTDAHPRLVSYDDVRASTQIPESLNRDPLPPRRSSVGRASDYITQPNEDLYTPDVTEGASIESSQAARGYDSIFDSTASTTPVKPSSEVGVSVHTSVSETPLVSDTYDPYRAYEDRATAGSSTSHRPKRTITVLAPMAYNEVENVARMVRAGDVVVLSLRNTPNQLSKRMLDFSFGVASALNASVDCISEKVFAITQGQQLTEDERARLRSQGVI